jgi:hypothetical protein
MTEAAAQHVLVKAADAAKQITGGQLQKLTGFLFNHFKQKIWRQKF